MNSSTFMKFSKAVTDIKLVNHIFLMEFIYIFLDVYRRLGNSITSTTYMNWSN